MVVHDVDADRLFGALADATRRDILARTLVAEHSVSDLAGHYPMSFAAVQKHVAVLERAGLVSKRRNGREQRVRGSVQALARTQELLDQLESSWRGRLDRIDDLLGTTTPAGTPRDTDGEESR